MKTCLQLFLHTSNLLFSAPPPPNLSQVAQAQSLLNEILYDLTCQDLPPDVEDALPQLFGSPTGLLLRLLAWDSPQLEGDVRYFRIVAS